MTSSVSGDIGSGDLAGFGDIAVWVRDITGSRVIAGSRDIILKTLLFGDIADSAGSGDVAGFGDSSEDITSFWRYWFWRQRWFWRHHWFWRHRWFWRHCCFKISLVLETSLVLKMIY